MIVLRSLPACAGTRRKGLTAAIPGPRGGSWFVGSAGVRRISEPKAAPASVVFAVR